jgi:hypothetical protein
MIAVTVELLRKLQNLGRAKFNAEAAALARVPIDKDLTPELPSFRRWSALRHVNLDKKRYLATVMGTCCPNFGPECTSKHFYVHFDRTDFDF